MRKQPRIAAASAALLLSSGLTAADVAAAPPAATTSTTIGRTAALGLARTAARTSAAVAAPVQAPIAAPAAAPTPPPPPARVVAPRASRTRARTVTAHAGSTSSNFARLRQCESGGNYAANTGNGYYGAYQFSASTWRSLGYSGLPHQASAGTQDQAAIRLQARAGWGQWPSCARRLGLR